MKGFNEDYGLGHRHGEAVGKCLVVESLAASLENCVSLLSLIVNDVVDSQRARCVCEDDGSGGCRDSSWSWSSWCCSTEGGDLSLESLNERKELFDGWRVGCHGLGLSPCSDRNDGRCLVLLGAILQQILQVEILLGDQDQNMLARKLLGADNCAEEACYLSIELGSG